LSFALYTLRFELSMLIGVDASRAFLLQRTGTENYTWQLLLALAKLECEHSFRVYTKASSKFPAFGGAGTVQSSKFEEKTINWEYLWTQGGLALETWRRPVDALFIPAHVIPFLKNPRVPTIVTVHDLGFEFLPWYQNPIQRFYLSKIIEKLRSRSATHIIAVSKSTKKDLIEKLGVPEGKISVVYEGTDRRFAPELKIKSEKLKIISGDETFNLYQSYGFPLELTEELAKERGFKVAKEGFLEAQKKHQDISRAGAEKKFGGVGEETGYESVKLHTATHLLHSALRQVLGEHVKQMGSDITPQRLRFDFSHPQKMTDKEIKKVEEIVNQKIKEDLEVKKEEMAYEKAIKLGALAFFREKYPPIVTVYSITRARQSRAKGGEEDLSSSTGDFSKEICAGPHVRRTSELGQFKIVKEESSGSSVRRIRAVLVKLKNEQKNI